MLKDEIAKIEAGKGNHAKEIHDMKITLNTIAERITPKMVKEMNKYFETKGNFKLVKMMEILIGGLRYVEKATNVDVELYLKKHESLIYKMANVDPSLAEPQHAAF